MYNIVEFSLFYTLILIAHSENEIAIYCNLLFFTLKLCGKYVSKKNNALLKEYYFINIHKTNYNTKHFII